jgi:hypothetical protein
MRARLAAHALRGLRVEHCACGPMHGARRLSSGKPWQDGPFSGARKRLNIDKSNLGPSLKW